MTPPTRSQKVNGWRGEVQGRDETAEEAGSDPSTDRECHMRNIARVAAVTATITALTLSGSGTANAAPDPGPRKSATKTRVIDRDTCRYRFPGARVTGNLVLLEHSRGGKATSRTVILTWSGLQSVRKGATTITTFPHKASLTRAYRDGSGRESQYTKKTRGKSVSEKSLAFSRSINPKKPVRAIGQVAWSVDAKIGRVHAPSKAPLRCSLTVSAKPSR